MVASKELIQQDEIDQLFQSIHGEVPYSSDRTPRLVGFRICLRIYRVSNFEYSYSAWEKNMLDLSRYILAYQKELFPAKSMFIQRLEFIPGDNFSKPIELPEWKISKLNLFK